jgi:hypothetical protein
MAAVAEFQPGSGSWDGLFGLAVSQRLTSAVSFHANVLAIANGTGAQNTNLGNHFLYNAALSHAGHSHEPKSCMAIRAATAARVARSRRQGDRIKLCCCDA